MDNRYRFLPAALVCAGLVLACGEKAPEKVEYMVLGEFVNPEDSLPRVRYFESNLVTLNERCPVRKVKLNTKMPAVYVNGQPIGFC